METTGSFWAFATELYQRDGVEDACLWLQDNADVDVVALLYCCWLGLKGFSFADDEALKRHLHEARAWGDHLIKPLRQARRWYRQQYPGTAGETLYPRLKEAELAAEKALITRLEILAGEHARGDSRSDDALHLARENIQAYLSLAGIALPPRGLKALNLLLARC